jgi:hypothetical protein
MPETVVDNDILLKVACYGLFEGIFPDARVGVLGAAKYVLRNVIQTKNLTENPESAISSLESFIFSAEVVEPTEQEQSFAADLESHALDLGLNLDS